MRCDKQDDLIVVDTENNAARRIHVKTGTGTTIAGGHQGGDGGNATDAGLERPHGCGIDHQGNLYIADGINHRVRVVGMRWPAQAFNSLGSGDFGTGRCLLFLEHRPVWVYSL